MRDTRLIVMAGLPGSGKSSIADALARRLDRPVISIDPIEAAMWRSGIPRSMTGLAAYHVAETIAAENLRLGLSVVIDAVNPIDAARDGWMGLAARQKVEMLFVECECPDLDLHRDRIARRRRDIDGMAEISWDEVEARRREYQSWSHDRIVLDTSKASPEMLSRRVLDRLGLRDG